MQQSTHVQGWEGSLHWQQTDKAMLRRISLLILDTQREPLADVGKSESLNLVLAATGRGAIGDEHRVDRTVTDDEIIIAQLRGYYD